MENSSERSTRGRHYHRSNVPRLRWTNELHQCFADAVDKLGGVSRATPKTILEMMNVKGLNETHIKSHLQMYRNMKNEIRRQEEELEEQAKANKGKKPRISEQNSNNDEGLGGMLGHQLEEQYYKHIICNTPATWRMLEMMKYQWKVKFPEPDQERLTEYVCSQLNRREVKKQTVPNANTFYKDFFDTSGTSNGDGLSDGNEIEEAGVVPSPLRDDLELTLGGPYAPSSSSSSSSSRGST